MAGDIPVTGPTPREGERVWRILTVCLGNYCRSPLAAAALARLGGKSLEVRSAGIRQDGPIVTNSPCRNTRWTVSGRPLTAAH
ncbi:hypothetical protein PUR57_12880 [Streptomyces sp. JV176]|uniref:arsenate reductase/protein-tyrosine-phosphatase family protein n=1 Tax=Streptomyces sp. JV176 TaxID=858630 RepID=UPI002E75A8B6|nr:hypothetical protein [Streptomyces sp. JV176]MEE1799556.1 hypothetical protein [Streptomyces sp. JV176]